MDCSKNAVGGILNWQISVLNGCVCQITKLKSLSIFLLTYMVCRGVYVIRMYACTGLVSVIRSTAFIGNYNIPLKNMQEAYHTIATPHHNNFVVNQSFNHALSYSGIDKLHGRGEFKLLRNFLICYIL